MSTAECVRCARPMPDVAYCCAICASQAAENLRLVVEVTPAARDVATGQSRRSSGGGSGKPGSRLPLDLTATAKLDAVSNTMTSWARHVSESRGIELPEPPVQLPNPMIGPLCRTRYECTHDSCKIMRDGDEWGWDAIVVSAAFLAERLEWMRHRPEADEFLGDVDAAARVMRSVARGPRDKQFLGICGATITWDDKGDEVQLDEPCAGYVFGTDKVGVCCQCKAQWDDVAQRLDRLDAEIRERLFTAKDIADAYEINVKTIRSWHDRGQLAAHGYDQAGVPLHKIGEVLDLAAADAARREEARAKRARRLQQRSGGAAA